MGEINITFESLFDILRAEKSSEELQKLPDSFVSNVVDYLKEMHSILESSKDNLEKQETSDKISNAKEIITEIYDRREKKIVEIAINKARIESAVIDTSALLKEEEIFYNCIIEVLKKSRNDYLFKILNMESPETSSVAQCDMIKEEAPKSMMVRFKNSVPKFLGKEGEIYGPYEEDDMASFPSEIAEILVKKGRAELM